MSIEYTVQGQQFTHRIRPEWYHPIAFLRCIRRVCSAIGGFFRALWDCCCSCTCLADRHARIAEPEWSSRVMAEPINTRNERLNACHIPEPTPAINYLNAVRRHRGQQDAEIDTAAAELTPATAEMINGNYAQVLAGNAQTAFEEAVVICEALMFEGAQALPSYHPERDVPDRPPGNEEDEGTGVEENVPTGRLPAPPQLSCNAFLRMLKAGDVNGATAAYTHLEQMCAYQLGSPNFHENVEYILQHLPPPRA